MESSSAAIISIYKNIHDAKSKETIHLNVFLDAIQSGKWQDDVLKIRTIRDHDERQLAKRNLPYVTISGFFSEGRSMQGLTNHSGYLSIDLDDLGNELEGVRTLLAEDPYVYAIFTSVSGSGLCVLFKIDPEKHSDAFDGVSNYFLSQYQLLVDTSGRDVSRARYVSFDPDLYRDDSAMTFRKYMPKQKQRKVQATIFVQDEFDRIINAMAAAQVNCVEDYREWLTIGFGLADQFGEAGRRYFHVLSLVSHKYESSICDKQYTICLKGDGRSGKKVTIATIYWYAKQAGIQIHSDKTKKVAAAASTMKKAGLSAAAIATNLEKFEGISNVDDIIKQAISTPADFSQGETLVENIRMWLRHNFELKRNLITRKIENVGRVLDEIDLNTMFLEALIVFEKLTFDLFMKVLFSSNTIEYNPIQDWFKNNSTDIQPSGVIDKLFSAFETDNDLLYFGKKWMVSVVASAFGEHSPLMLIFAGERHGSGKTESFRRILPPDLKMYYAEITQGIKEADFNIMMTQKLIVMDDECGGKSKRDAMHLKLMLSTQTFTLREPYGRLNVDLTRLAVLCGTSNYLDLLNDPTGNRRMLPMEIKSVNFDVYNSVDKTELWIEAYQLFLSGFDWRVSGEDIERLATGTDKFHELCAETEMLQKYFTYSDTNFLTATEIKNKLEVLTVQKYSLRKIGMELNRLKYVRKKKSHVWGYMIEEIDGITRFVPGSQSVDPLLF